MANRVLKPSICTSEDINRLSFFEEVIFYRLIVSADEKGRLDGRPEIIKANLFPLKRDITLTAIRKALSNMATVGLIELSEEGGRSILKLSKWECHQRIRSTSDPLIGEEERDSAAPRGAAPRNAAGEEKERKKKKNPPTPPFKKEINKEKEERGWAHACENAENPAESFSPPTLEDVRDYCQSNALNVNAELWIAHYISNGWTIGGTPMRDWRASLRVWHLKNEQFTPNTINSRANGGITECSFESDEFLQTALKKSMEGRNV